MRNNYFKYFALFSFLFIGFVSNAQNKKKDDNKVNEQALENARLSNLNSAQELCRIIGAEFDVPVINYEPVTPPKFWFKGLLSELGFSQVSLTNWAAGGSGSIALNGFLNGHINYEKGGMYWENRMQMGYGFIQSYKDGYRKSNDVLIFDSKWGYKAIDKFYFSAIFNFKSQLTPGFEYPNGKTKLVSKFLSPGYTSLGLGMEYKNNKRGQFSLNFAPLTASCVIVTDTLLRVKYGNKKDETVRFQLGAQLKMSFRKDLFKNFKIGTDLSLFSDYLNNPQNMRVFWDFQADMQLNKYFRAGIRTNLIYDDKILIAGKDGKEYPRVQFREIFSLNFAYTLGMFKK